MTASSKLSALQRAVLEHFFRKGTAFFLTGGAALTEFYLHHRRTDDLDLFGTPGADIEQASRTLRLAVDEVGATSIMLEQSPDFRRFAVTRGDERTIVDLVIDRARQLIADKVTFGVIRVDPLREIAANKICALLGRSAPRDLVDLKAILGTGVILEDVLADAMAKDAGVNPATLAWVLESQQLSPEQALPNDVAADELDAFRRELIRNLTTLALPGSL